MKKLMAVAAAAAITTATAMPAMAQQATPNDPFLATQSLPAGFAGVIGPIVVAGVVVGVIIAVSNADGSTSTTEFFFD